MSRMACSVALKSTSARLLGPAGSSRVGLHALPWLSLTARAPQRSLPGATSKRFAATTTSTTSDNLERNVVVGSTLSLPPDAKTVYEGPYAGTFKYLK